MAHFFGWVRGNRGDTSRTGSKNSGYTAVANGWNTGARVRLHHNPDTGLDEVAVYRTGGSNAAHTEILVAAWTQKAPWPT